jgi:hypothetical protein
MSAARFESGDNHHDAKAIEFMKWLILFARNAERRPIEICERKMQQISSQEVLNYGIPQHHE